MEAVAVAASAAVAAAKEEALATAVAAAAAVKDATAKEAVAASSAAELTGKEAAVKASAAVLNAKEAAAVAENLEEAAAAAAAVMQASKKRKFHLIDNGQDPLGSEDVDDGESVDLISCLPDSVLGSIVSLLPTKDSARMQAISRLWRPLWRLAPLNLELKSKGRKTIDMIQKILSEHPGPARRFSLGHFTSYFSDKIEGWLGSQALYNLQDLELTYTNMVIDMKEMVHVLPLSAFRFAPTLREANFVNCHFPNLIVPKFPCLKQLTLDTVTISDDALQSMLSGCTALESLELKGNPGIGRLYISSQTLKSLGFYASRMFRGTFLQELVIKDAPCLERLLPLDPKYGTPAIRIISAPQLKILGMLSEDIEEFQFGTTVFQKMIAVSLTTKMHTVKVLVLDSSGPNLDTVVNFLKCFPCLERLYVTVQTLSCPRMLMNNSRKYDPLDPIECLELHLKEVVLKNYSSYSRTNSPSIDFAKFFVLNAKVLKEMKITLPYHRQQKWFDNQHRLLQIKDRAWRCSNSTEMCS